MTFTCGNCSRDSLACACAEGPVLFCQNCGLEPATQGSEECMPCLVAFLLTDPTQLALIQKLHAGTPWLAKLNAEAQRQIGATVEAARRVA